MATVSGDLTSAYVANTDNLHTRSIYKKIYDRYNEGTFVDFFEQTGRKEIADQTNFKWFERDWIAATATITGSPSGTGAGVATTLTLASASHTTSGTRSPFNPGDLLMIQNSSGYYRVIVQAKSTAVASAHTITVDPVIDTEDVGGNVAATDIIVKIGTAFAEGTDQPNSISVSPLQYSNNTQIYKKEAKVTGTEATNKIEFTVNGQPYYYYEVADSAYIDMKNDMEFGLLLAQAGTPVDTDGNTVYVTSGLDEQITTNGQTQNYTIAFDDMAYINDMVKTLSIERAPKENLLLAGIQLNLDIDDLITDTMRNGGIVYNQFGKGNGGEKAIDLGVDSFVKGGYVFHKKNFDALNHAQITASANGGNWPSVGYVIPLDTVKDASSNEKLDSISLMYKSSPIEDRLFRHWKREKEVTNNDSIELEWLAECGLRVAGANRFIKITPA